MRRSWILAGVGGLVVIGSVLPWPSALQGKSVCWLRNTWDLPCPGCGLTRSVRALGHGDFSLSWQHNPFGIVFFALALVLLLAPLWERWWPNWDQRLLANRSVRWVGIGLMSAMLIFGLLRILDTLASRA